MSEDQFTKLFKYIQHMKADMDARFEMMASKQQVDAILKGLQRVEARLKQQGPNLPVIG